MKSFQLCHTVTDSGHYYYVNGKRVTRSAYDDAKFWRRIDCIQVSTTKKAVRYFCVATAE